MRPTQPLAAGHGVRPALLTGSASTGARPVMRADEPLFEPEVVVEALGLPNKAATRTDGFLLLMPATGRRCIVSDILMGEVIPELRLC